jgi:hypothetical protein
MRGTVSLRRRLRLPSQVALLLGLGALSAAGARADTGLDQPGAGPAPLARGDQASAGEVLIRTEGGRIYLSERGGEFQELRLGNIPEAHLLKQLLDGVDAAAGSTGIRLSPVILAGNGGEGFHWPPGGRAAKRDQPGPAGSTPAAGTPAPPAPAQNPGAPGKATSGRIGEKG